MSDRRKGLGASDAAAACGLSKWRTPLELYLAKIGEGAPTEETLPMRVGKALEPVMLRAFAEERGVELCDQQRRFHDPVLPWRWATVDAITSSGALVEAKTAGSALGWGEDVDQVPMEYALQVQHALAVTGLELAFIPVLIAGRQFRVYELPRDAELIELLTERERAFWRCVETRTPPEPVTLAEVNMRWRKQSDGAVLASVEVAADVELLRAFKENIKDYETDAEAIETRIKLAMKDAPALTLPDGHIIASWKNQSARRLNQVAFKAAHPALAAEFTTETESRVFRLHK